MTSMMRIGEGWDVHALVPGRALVVGGVVIDHPLGLLGHSDADVLLHAITDALLGAAALGDIGSHFPDTDARHRGAMNEQHHTVRSRRDGAGLHALAHVDVGDLPGHRRRAAPALP